MTTVNEALHALEEALNRLILDDPGHAMREAARAEALARDAAQRAVVAACVAAGASWSDVGAAFGVSRQAAHQRFARHVRSARP